MDKKIIKRSSNWDQDEKDILSNIVLDKLEIVENTRIDTNSNKKKRQAWSSILTLFSSASKTERSLDQIQSQWRKIKCVARTKNSSFLRQQKQTGGGPPPEALNSVEEELVTRLPKQFEHDFNIYDSNNICNVSNEKENSQQNKQKEKPHKIETSQQSNDKRDEDLSFCLDEILSSDEEDEKKATFVERKKSPKKSKKNIQDDEKLKRIQFLEISVLQKETEMEQSKILFENKNCIYEQKKKKVKLEIEQMYDEHQLKMQKLKLELEDFKKKGFFN